MNEALETPTQVTVNELNELSAKIAHLRDQERAASDAKKEITKDLENQEAKMLELLELAGLKNYRSPHGLVSLAFRSSVRVPATPEDKEKLFEYLKQQGDYDSLISVNSMTLNSYYKSKLEEAIQAGATEFSIPGVGAVTMTPILSFRKA